MPFQFYLYYMMVQIIEQRSTKITFTLNIALAKKNLRN